MNPLQINSDERPRHGPSASGDRSLAAAQGLALVAMLCAGLTLASTDGHASPTAAGADAADRAGLDDPPEDLPPPAIPSDTPPPAQAQPETGATPEQPGDGSAADEPTGPGDADGTGGAADAPVYEPPEPMAGALAPQQPLTDWERSVLMQGPVSEGSWILGGILGTWMGFGMGHLAQGRFGESGLLFAGGEIGTLILLGIAIPSAFDEQVVCNQNGCFVQQNQRDLWQGVAIGAGVAFIALRVWEIYDVWAGPAQWNDAYRRIRARAGPAPMRFSFGIVPTQGGGTAFGQLRF